jgi:hypothetical protein
MALSGAFRPLGLVLPDVCPVRDILDFGIRLGVVDVWSRCLFSYDNSNFIFIKLYNFTLDICVVTVAEGMLPSRRAEYKGVSDGIDDYDHTYSFRIGLLYGRE